MNVQLVPFDLKYLAQYLTWVNDPEIGLRVDRALPVTETEHGKWYHQLIEDPQTVVFAITTELNSDDHRYLGNVWLADINFRHRKAEVRILIGDSNYQGKRYGTAALESIVSFAFNKLNLHRVYAYVLGSNGRAERAFKRAGFETEGVLLKDRFIDGEYRDVLVMARLNSGQ